MYGMLCWYDNFDYSSMCYENVIYTDWLIKCLESDDELRSMSLRTALLKNKVGESLFGRK